MHIEDILEDIAWKVVDMHSKRLQKSRDLGYDCQAECPIEVVWPDSRLTIAIVYYIYE